MTRKAAGVDIAIVTAVSLLFVLPPVLFGFIGGHDVQAHLLWSKYFAAQLYAGDLYPRWLTEMNSGYGSPVFFYYPPVAYYITSAFHLFSGPTTDGWLELGLSCSLALAASGIAAYAWLSSVAGRGAALFGALFYVLMPYHLAVDIHLRFAFAELWAFVWMPAAMLFSRRLVERRRGALVGVAVTYALLIMTHLPTALVFSPLPALYAMCVSEPRARWRCCGRMAMALTLGLGLSCIYLIPALTLQHHVNMESLWLGNLRYDRTFLFMGTSAHKQLMNLAALLTAGLAACAYSLVGELDRKREARYWLAVAFATLFMMLPVSLPLWHLLPPLQRIQFPWRLCSLLALAGTALLGLGELSFRKFAPASGAGAKIAVCACFALAGIMAAPNITWSLARLSSDKAIPGGTSERPEYRTNWRQTPGLPDRADHSPDERARLMGGPGHVRILQWAPRSIVLACSSPSAGELEVDQFYYPGWTATHGMPGKPLPLKPSHPEGLIRIFVPSGETRLTLTLEPQAQELLGRALTAFSALLVAAWGAYLKVRPAVGDRSGPKPE